MLIALATGNKIGLFSVAAVFIVFALASSFLFPRLNPDFPGRSLRLFVVAVVVLTLAMLGAVEVFAKEDHHEGEAAAETTTGQETTEPTQTTEPTETTATTEPTETVVPTGDAEAGKALFASEGCAACHALGAADATGTVGPDLDKTLAGKDAVYIEQSIVDPNAEIADGYLEGVMPTIYGDTLDEQQVDDLVALISQ